MLRSVCSPRSTNLLVLGSGESSIEQVERRRGWFGFFRQFCEAMSNCFDTYFSSDFSSHRRADTGLNTSSASQVTQNKTKSVDEDWHAICQAIFQAVEDQNWIPCNTITKSRTMRSSVRNLGENKKAMVLWSVKEAKDNGVDDHDLGSVQKIHTIHQERFDLWVIHLKTLDGCSGSRTETYTARM